MSVVRVVGAALVLCLGLTACRTPATQVNLEIGSSCGRIEDRTVRLLVSDGAGSSVSDETIAVTAWPIRRTLIPRGGDATRRWRLEVTLLDARGVVVLDDTQVLEGGYTSAASVPVAVTVRDPACEDAGTFDAGMDAGPDASGSTEDAGLDASSSELDAWSPDSGCRVAPRRETAQLLLDYEFRRDPTRPDTIAERGTNRGIDLVGDPGVVGWGAGGLGASIGAIAGRPSVSPSALEAHIDDPAVACRRPPGLTVEAWVTLPADTLPTDDRAELFVFSQPGTVVRRGFTLGLDEQDLIAGIDNCDGAMRPLFRFERPARRPTPVHIVYLRRGMQEHAFIDGREVPLLAPRLEGERNAGCGIELDAGAPAVVLGGRTTPLQLGSPPLTVHLGSFARSDGTLGSEWRRAFTGTYHRLAVYCRALDDLEVLENYCAGPHPS